MKAIILAAGRGERMRPLTDHCPKPMLKVAGLPLIEHHLNKLKAIGITEVVINHAWCGEQIEQYFGDGSKWQIAIRYSAEKSGALETAGGILKALPLLTNTGLTDTGLTDTGLTDTGLTDTGLADTGLTDTRLTSAKLNTEEPQTFLVVNGDIYCDFDFSNLPSLPLGQLAHLWLVPNPAHNLSGDFVVEGGILKNKSNSTAENTFTYSGIGIYHRDFFKDLPCQEEKISLGPMLRQSANLQEIGASILNDFWTDVGTPERLEQLNQKIS